MMSDVIEINTTNGVLQAQRSSPFPVHLELRSYPSAKRPAAMLACGFDPEARCPEFVRHIQMVIPNDTYRRAFQCEVGRALGGLGRGQVLVLQGHGANGKSVTMDLFRSIMGTYAEVLDPAALQINRSVLLDGEVYRKIATARLLTVDGLDGRRLNLEAIKAISAGERIVFRDRCGEPVETHPLASLMFTANSMFKVNAADALALRRAVAVPFTHSIPPAAMNWEMREILRAEYAGILNWMLEGLARYLVSAVSLEDAA